LDADAYVKNFLRSKVVCSDGDIYSQTSPKLHFSELKSISLCLNPSGR